MENLTYSNPRLSARPKAEEIRELIFWAGKNLRILSLPQPKPYLRQSFLCQTTFTQFEFKLSPGEISRLESILELVCLVSDPLSRRIIHARSQINPQTSAHIFSWARIAKQLNLNPKTVRLKFDRGLDEIRAKIDQRVRENINGG